MTIKIIKAASLGFCPGVRRAIDITMQVAKEQGGVETLGALVHNRQVLKKLAGSGVSTVSEISSINGDKVIISAHGASPRVLADIDSRGLTIIDTTCSFVKRAQNVARRLADDGFFILIYGDVNHPEVKGILGWADNHGMAALNARDLGCLPEMPQRLGILSQTTQIPADFLRFVNEVLDLAFGKDSEIRVIDTICHETRRRQADTLSMAKESDLVLVIGGRNSANTRRLFELCSAAAETHHIETADEIEPGWLTGKKGIGLAAGASTDDETIDEVITRLENLTQG
jgi:4-hydroxy-3-methylbut-2-enyl diphosphate reductase